MGVKNWKQRVQERKQWKEIIEQAKTQRVVELNNNNNNNFHAVI
jgi:mevalonate pyrophosphate decarboxylase